MAVRFRTRATSLALAIAAMMLASTPRGQAQTASDRRGGPRDWSHSQIVTAAGGLDVDGRDARDWRTVLKHRRIAQSNLQRANAAASPAEPDLGWEAGPEFVKRVRPLPEDGGELPLPTGAAPDLDWSLRTGGYGNVVGYPAKYSTNWDITTYNCADIIYFTVDQAGTATAANVIALTNVYIGCTGNPAGATPTVKFALRLPNGTATSPVPSEDGTILYVFESNTAGAASILHAIQVDNITSTPGTYNFTAPGNWTSVHTLKTTPIGGVNDEQLWQRTFAANNASSPFLDYLNNEIYFGDATGDMHRIINVTSAGAAEATGFPVQCGTVQLTSPLRANGQVIAGSADGRLYRIDVGAGSTVSVRSARQGSGTAAGAAGGLATPLADVSNGKIIYVTGDSGTNKEIGVINLVFPATGDSSTRINIGLADGVVSTSAALDDAFWSTNAGNLYVVGGSMDSAKARTYLIRVPYNGTAVSAASGYVSLRNGAYSSQPTTPVTEFLTASSLANPDFLFVGGGGGSYLYMNRISSGFLGVDGNSLATDSSFAVPGGVISGIGIDTQSALITGQAKANIYFGTMGIGPSTTQSTIVQLAQQF